MKTAILTLTTLGLMVPCASSNDEPTEKVSVFVNAEVEAEDGFTKFNAKDLSDSAEDLRKQVKKRKLLVLAPNEESADIVVTVLDRQLYEGRETGYRQTGQHIQTDRELVYSLTYLISAGSYAHEDTIEHSHALATWGGLAGDLAKKVEGWAKENMARLLELRGQR